MPNDCENTLTITGPAEAVQAFQEFAKSDLTPLEIDNFVSMPEEVRNTSSPNRDQELAERLSREHGAPDWYEWAKRNWGTKLGAYDVDMTEVDDATTRYRFCTAWTPVNQNVMEAMTSRFPSLRIKLEYNEPGAGFRGYLIAGC